MYHSLPLYNRNKNWCQRKAVAPGFSLYNTRNSIRSVMGNVASNYYPHNFNKVFSRVKQIHLSWDSIFNSLIQTQPRRMCMLKPLSCFKKGLYFIISLSARSEIGQFYDPLTSTSFLSSALKDIINILLISFSRSVLQLTGPHFFPFITNDCYIAFTSLCQEAALQSVARIVSLDRHHLLLPKMQKFFRREVFG